jgi:pimeloyl-ACP methyl ester carboxylesterase
MKRLHSIFLLGLLTISLSACTNMAQPATAPTSTANPIVASPATATAVPTATAEPQRTSAVKLEDCVIGNVAAQCGTYRMYETRSANSGRQIDLKIVVLPATGGTSTRDQVEPDPFFYFAGGPGGVASAYVPTFKTELRELNRTRDIVLIDQRGTGGSQPLSCPPLNDVSGPSDGDGLVPYYESCLKELNADLNWYTTKTYVDDVNEVRQALGYDKVNIAGESYGGTVVQIYLNEHPETVRTAAVLRSTLLDYPILEHFADSSQRALDLVFARCKQDEACHAAFPALGEEFAAIQAQLEKEPAPTSIRDAAAQPVVVTSDMFSTVIHYMLMGADTAAWIPRLIHRAAVLDDWDPIGRFYLEQIKPLLAVVLQQAMPVNILCHEPWAFYRPAQVTQNSQGSYYRTAQVAQAQLFTQFCPALPAPDPQAMYAAPRPTSAPVLVLNAEEDPQNPPANVADIATLYPNSLVLIEPYRAHFITEWSCSAQMLTEFVELGNVQDLKADCLSKTRPYAFDVRP